MAASTSIRPTMALLSLTCGGKLMIAMGSGATLISRCLRQKFAGGEITAPVGAHA